MGRLCEATAGHAVPMLPVQVQNDEAVVSVRARACPCEHVYTCIWLQGTMRRALCFTFERSNWLMGNTARQGVRLAWSMLVL